jgi:hypothetical protein
MPGLPRRADRASRPRRATAAKYIERGGNIQRPPFSRVTAGRTQAVSLMTDRDMGLRGTLVALTYRAAWTWPNGALAPGSLLINRCGVRPRLVRTHDLAVERARGC